MQRSTATHAVTFFAAALLLSAVAGAQPEKPPQPTVAILSSDASTVAAQIDAEVHVWDRATGKHLARIKNVGMFRGSLTSTALVAISDDGITVWRSHTLTRDFGRPVRLKLPRRMLAIGRSAISDDGRVVSAIFAHDGGVTDPDTVGLWDASNGLPLGRITLRHERVLGVAHSSDGKLVAIFGDHPGGKGAVLQVHRLQSRSAPRSSERPPLRVQRRPMLRWTSPADRTTYSATFAPGSQTLALGAGTRVLIWHLERRARSHPHLARSAPHSSGAPPLRGQGTGPLRAPPRQADTSSIKALFPAPLQVPSVSLPGAHALVFSPDGKQLLTLHAFGVVGVARWSVSPLRPMAWLKRPMVGGTMRQLAWDRAGKIWLVTSGYAPRAQIHTPRGDRFAPVRVLTP